MISKLKRLYLSLKILIVFVALIFVGIGSASLRSPVLAQGLKQESGEVIVTVVYPEQINVREGPSTVFYEIIGYMQPGQTAQALGVSPGRDWVQIEFPGGPGGVAWIHSSLIVLSPGNLQVVEPPPTATPRVTATIDPTLAAAYVFEPTATRLPTFTPPPMLEMPQFTEAPPTNSEDGFPLGAFVLGLGVLSVISYMVSLLRQR